MNGADTTRRWSVRAAGNNHWWKDLHAAPTVKYANHKRNAHGGAHDANCNACRELREKATK